MIPARTLRDQADDLLRQRKRLPTRHIAREDEIVAAATAFFATHGRTAITFGNAAAALRITPVTLRRYFADLDKLFAEILIRHLNAITDALARIPPDHPALQAARHEAYRNATRAPFSLSPTHFLLIQQRFTLPPDLLEPIEHMRASIGLLLDPCQPDLALSLLDNFAIEPAHAAALLAWRPEEPPAANPKPAATHRKPRPAKPQPQQELKPRHFPQPRPQIPQARAGP